MSRGKDQKHMETEEEVSGQHMHVYGGARKGKIHKPTVEDNTETCGPESQDRNGREWLTLSGRNP